MEGWRDLKELSFSLEDEMITVTESAGISGESVDAADHELVVVSICQIQSSVAKQNFLNRSQTT